MFVTSIAPCGLQCLVFAMYWWGTKSGQTTDRLDQHIPFNYVLHAVFHSGILSHALLVQPQSPSGYGISNALHVIKNELSDTKISHSKTTQMGAPLPCSFPYLLVSSCVAM